MKVNLTDWNIQDYLKTAEDRAFYLEAAIEEAVKTSDMNFLAEALGDVARAIGGEKAAQFLAGISTEIKAKPQISPEARLRKTPKRELVRA